MSHDNIQSHVKVYRNIFISLLIFTILTVLASKIRYFDEFNLFSAGIFIGLLIAVIKGYLVAANFMHLNNEKKSIYWILILTAAFLVLLMAIPILWDNNLVTSNSFQLWSKENHSSINGGHH